MGGFIDTILSNTIYVVVTMCILCVMVYFAVKKMTKIFIIAFVILIGFLSYVYFTEGSVRDAADKAGEVVN
jgi:hypothetical protein